MNMSAPVDTPPPLFKSLTAFRRAHTNLLEEYQKYDDEKDENTLPEFFIHEVETFLQQASGSGALLDIDEDRSDAQALLNYWTTVLYSSGKTPRPTILTKFDKEVVSKQIGARCPYRGLQAFHEEDRIVFYGRRQLASDMAKTLQLGNLLAVVGLSGSGKSSVVRAGLIPLLQEGALSDSESWTYYDPIDPGPEPLRSLSELTRPVDVTAEAWYQQHATQFLQDEAHLLKLVSTAGKTSVVIVDQFEELFTLSQDETERQAFVANLVRLAKATDPRQVVIITMRSEFDTYVARFPELQELFVLGQIRLSPLSPLDLRKAIEKPAERSGLSFEAGLVEELVQQVLGEPAGLPLLQFTLYQLWKHREGKNITRAIYEQLGGSPREILASVANSTFESFRLIEDRNISRRIMLRLVRPGAGLDVTSNRVHRAALSSVGARDNFDRVLEAWVKAGLLRVTAGAKREDDQVEIMHEALIRNWPMLVAWLEEERVHLRKRLQLTSAAQQWAEHKRDPGGLLGGTLLAEALTYDDLNALETEFVEASKKAALVAEQDKKDREQRLIAARKLQLRLATVFLVVAVGLLALAIWQTRKALAASTQATEEKGKAEAAKREAKLAETRIVETQNTADRKLLIAAFTADRKLSDLKLQTDEELSKLEGYKARAADAKKIVSDAAAKVSQIETETKAKLDESARITEQLEQNLKALAATLAETRPALVIENGHLGTLPGEWLSKLGPRTAEVEKTLASVGMLESTGTNSYVATAFLIAPDVVAAPYFGIEELTEAAEIFRIDFREKPDANPGFKFVATVIGRIEGYQMVLLRVSPQSPGGLKLPPPLVLAKNPQLRSGQPLYVVGYPFSSAGASAKLIEAVFGNLSGVKRLQPGYLLRTLPGEKRFNHDCFTLAGNSGSPVVDLETGKVIGLHIGGQGISTMGPGTKEAVSLWMLADNALMKAAGVKFQ